MLYIHHSDSQMQHGSMEKHPSPGKHKRQCEVHTGSEHPST
ncbi:hypothetical protein GBAR_LOCUS29046 [Geodia barretti]|uniref:Uncharacterized protein n=1 Tax=Geodia barretti TaxID=519541 RepID=A0AA35TU41_GEOBA|nr:hypothetical protein GBAR_LOCUS29046 [Geodia barretti]